MVYVRIRCLRNDAGQTAAGLFEYLDTGTTDNDPDALREAADREKPTLVDLERMAVAGLLTALQSQ